MGSPHHRQQPRTEFEDRTTNAEIVELRNPLLYPLQAFIKSAPSWTSATCLDPMPDSQQHIFYPRPDAEQVVLPKKVAVHKGGGPSATSTAKQVFKLRNVNLEAIKALYLIAAEDAPDCLVWKCGLI